MLFPVEKLIESKDKPLCVHPQDTIETALGLMISNNFSQLPIVDERGYLQGLISDQSIMRAHFHTGGSVSLLGLPVDHCLVAPAVVGREADIFKVIELLEDQYAVLVVESRQPLAIITYYDINQFFRELSEGLIFIEDIELTLRQAIGSVYPDEEQYKKALVRAMGSNKGVDRDADRKLSDLTLWEISNLISNKANWEDFKHLFSSREIFMHYMDNIREIRNQLVHFRGDLDELQMDCLRTTRQWVESRQRLPSVSEQAVPRIDVRTLESVSKSQGKYDNLRVYLEVECAGRSEVQLEFSEIEQLIGEELPRSASVHRSWWENDPNGHVQSRSWMSAGWAVERVDFENKAVLFKPNHYAKMQVVFIDLVNALKKRMPDATSAGKSSPQNWFAFSAKTRGMNYAWVFNNRGELHVELYIDREDSSENKEIFDQLFKIKEVIEEKIGAPLRWDRLDHRRASRISLGIPVKINAPLFEMEDAKQWALQTMMKFIDAFKPLIRNL
jgi:CBS domain-containing protein